MANAKKNAAKKTTAKKTTTNATDAKVRTAGQRKGGPTPKRNAASKAKQKNSDATRQWIMVAAAAVFVIVAFVVLGSMFFPDAATVDVNVDGGPGY